MQGIVMVTIIFNVLVAIRDVPVITILSRHHARWWSKWFSGLFNIRNLNDVSVKVASIICILGIWAFGTEIWIGVESLIITIKRRIHLNVGYYYFPKAFLTSSLGGYTYILNLFYCQQLEHSLLTSVHSDVKIMNSNSLTTPHTRKCLDQTLMENK